MRHQDMTDAQYKALCHLAERMEKPAGDVLDSAVPELCGTAVMVPWPEAGLWLGIEPDGYTHS
jgi:hypothetical protein